MRASYPYVERNSIEIRRALDAGSEILEGSGRLHAKHGRTWTDLSNAWEHALGNWRRSEGHAPLEPAAVRSALNEARTHLTRMMLETARIIVPDRLKAWANAKRIGDQLDFNARFVKEM